MAAQPVYLLHFDLSGLSPYKQYCGGDSSAARPGKTAADWRHARFDLQCTDELFERYLRTKAGLQHAARPLSIGLSLLLVFGIFIGVTVLVVPEVVKAIKLIVQITGGGLEQLAQMESNTALTSTPLGQLFEKVDIDWLGLKRQMEEWVKSRSGTLVNQVVGAAGSLAGGVITFSIGLIFAVYILAGKERLKHQASRVLHVWLPKRFVEELIHVAAVCSNTFRLFITGQQPKQSSSEHCVWLECSFCGFPTRP